MPATKLMPPSTLMKTTNPVAPSDRWGVSTAEKIVGSAGKSLSLLIKPNIGNECPGKQPRHPAKRHPANRRHDQRGNPSGARLSCKRPCPPANRRKAKARG